MLVKHHIRVYVSYTLQICFFCCFFTMYKLAVTCSDSYMKPLNTETRGQNTCVHCPELHCVLIHPKANRRKGFRTQYFTPEALPEWIRVNMNCNSMLTIPSICWISSHLFELFIHTQNINVHESPVKENVIFIPCIRLFSPRKPVLPQFAAPVKVCPSYQS